MPMKRRLSLQAIPEPVLVVQEEAELEAPVIEFDPEFGKASDNPFAKELNIQKELDITLVNNYEALKVVDLKDILRQRSLPVSGTKAVLIARLEASDSEAAQATSGDDEEGPLDEAPSEGEVSEYGEPEQSVGESNSEEA